MHKLTKLIKEDMRPALGVTEPGAIAYSFSLARSHVKGSIKSLELELNSGMFKNAFTCGIPKSSEIGIMHLAALGALAADHKKGLLCLDSISAEDEERAKELESSGIIKVKMSEISSRIFIKATVVTELDSAEVVILNSHTNVVSIKENGKLVFEKKEASDERDSQEHTLIHQYSLKEILDYVDNVSIDEIEFIMSAFDMNLELSMAALNSDKAVITKHLFKENGNTLVSNDEKKTASLLCTSAIEARVLGIPLPAMSITGSGSHGIIATMIAYAHYKVGALSKEKLLRSTLLSFLICMYIKEYSGKLSAFCGCAIAAGCGSAAALTYLKGGGYAEIESSISNIAMSITGMICDGGNHGCALKGLAAVDAAERASSMALENVSVSHLHGINGRTAEETMRYMGLIASPGMAGTEKTILEILEEKQKG